MVSDTVGGVSTIGSGVGVGLGLGLGLGVGDGDVCTSGCKQAKEKRHSIAEIPIIIVFAFRNVIQKILVFIFYIFYGIAGTVLPKAVSQNPGLRDLPRRGICNVDLPPGIL